MLLVSVLVAVGLLVAVKADQIVGGESDKGLKKFRSDTPGLDHHNDNFYFVDRKVDDAFKRINYLEIKTTLAGQEPDLAHLAATKQPPAANPFVVAQTASTPLGSLMDRWDHKENEKEHQFFALYHGVGSTYVVNKLRSQLLRRLANQVQDSLLLLDQSIEDPKFNENTQYQEDIKKSVAHIIRSTYAEIDQNIRDSMNNNDDSQAAATVLIVTQHYVIVCNSGEGRVLGYDSLAMLRDLTSEAAIISGPVVAGEKKEFGAKKSKSKGLAEPDLAFFERNFFDKDGDPAKIQFLTIESGPVAQALKDPERTKKIVISQVDMHKYRKENEQDLHRGVVTNILRAASKETGVKRWVMNIDFSAIFIALETVYTNIH